MLTSLPMKRNETVKQYCQRVKTAGEEAQTIILSKLKEYITGEPTVTDMFELMMMDAVVREMHSHSKYREIYNQIVTQIDSCVTLDQLSQQVSKVADRKVTTDEMSEPKAYLTAKPDTKLTPDPMVAMGKQMDKVLALIAQGQPNKSTSTNPDKSKPHRKGKGKRDRTDFTDPEYRARVANYKCRLYTNRNECDRTNCPFSPCNEKTASKTYYSKDF